MPKHVTARAVDPRRGSRTLRLALPAAVLLLFLAVFPTALVVRWNAIDKFGGRLFQPYPDGKEYVADLLKQDRGKAVKEIEATFEWAAEEYADVKLDSETIADRAKAELFEIRHLSVGKVAPDIAGEDQDGRRFELSDYRGKVVLLDFWSYV